MNKLCMLALVGAVSATSSTMAAAADSGQWAVGGAVGPAQFVNSELTQRATSTKLIVSRQLESGWSVEAGVVNFGRTSEYRGTTLAARGAFVEGVFQHPIEGPWALLAKAGVLIGRVDAKYMGVTVVGDSEIDLKFGVGAAYQIDKRWALTAELERYRFKAFDGRVNGDMLSLGVRASF